MQKLYRLIYVKVTLRFFLFVFLFSVCIHFVSFLRARIIRFIHLPLRCMLFNSWFWLCGGRSDSFARRYYTSLLFFRISCAPFIRSFRIYFAHCIVVVGIFADSHACCCCCCYTNRDDMSVKIVLRICKNCTEFREAFLFADGVDDGKLIN